MIAITAAVQEMDYTEGRLDDSDPTVLEGEGPAMAPEPKRRPPHMPERPTATVAMVQEKTHAKAKAGAKAKATVTIWNQQFDAARVSMAKQQLTRVIAQVGHRHPEILGEAETIKHFTSEPESAEKLDGGLKALGKVLNKVDELEKELEEEKRTTKIARRKRELECSRQVRISERNIRNSQTELRNQNTVMDGYGADIKKLREQIKVSESMEGGDQGASYESQMGSKRKEIAKHYAAYWVLTDENAKVRNVLMQAMWLVCYGFRSFRHDPFCENLRKQPDYGEPGTANGRASGSRWHQNQRISKVFAKTMRSVWGQQKMADLHVVNKADGDASSEKGFWGNKAPWGVDPSAFAETESLIQQQVGVPKRGEFTNKEMAKRLNLLLEASDASDKVTEPIQSLVTALQTAAGNKMTEAVRETAKGLVNILVGLDREVGEDQLKADVSWVSTKNSLAAETQMLSRNMGTEASTQDKSMEQISHIENKMRIIKEGVRDHEAAEAAEAAEMKKTINGCERDYIEFDAKLEVVDEELVNIMRLNSLLRFLALGEDPKPKCTAASGVPCNKGAEHGTCTWRTRGKDDPKGPANKDSIFCACEYGWYGTNCELRKCPGFGRILYRANQDGVCSNRGGDCRGSLCANTGCNTKDGSCTCSTGHYHGTENKCELRYCPYKVDRSGAPVFASSTSRETCGGKVKGLCNHKRGKCECKPNYWGDHCGYKKCPASNAEGNIIGFFRSTSPNACDGRGACQSRNGSCKCGGDHYYGTACQFASCGGGRSDKNQCSGKGTCNPKKGLCFCNRGASGGKCKLCRDCRYKTCAAKCENTGYCDRLAGKCVCYSGNYNGATCKEPCRHNAYYSDWSRSMDKWGWSVCKKGWLLTGLRRDGDGNALYNIAAAKCEQPCEGRRENIPISHCYHENWWKKFDSAGGKFCRKNYFVAGLFRSHCNSLYCLEMAKCCQVKRSMWNDCKWASMSNWRSRRNWSTVSGKKAFVSGFYRSSTHTLDGLTWFRQCVPVFWGANSRD